MQDRVPRPERHDFVRREAEDPWARLCRRVAAFGGQPPEVIAVPIAGTGIAALEACFARLVQPGGGLLVLDHGPSSRPLVRVAEALRIPHHVERVAPDAPLDLGLVEARLRVLGRAISHLALVHHHRGTGLLEALDRIVELARCHGVEVIVEASASYGVLPVPVGSRGADVVVVSADGALQGPSGASFVVARQRVFAAARAWPARSLYLDLVAEDLHITRHGTPRFPLPDALRDETERALDVLDDEGRAAGRAARHARTGARLLRGLESLGFEPMLPASARGGWMAAFRPPAGVDVEAMARDSSLAPLAPTIVQVAGRALLGLSAGGALDVEEVEVLLTSIAGRLVRPTSRLAPFAHPE